MAFGRALHHLRELSIITPRPVYVRMGCSGVIPADRGIEKEVMDSQLNAKRQCLPAWQEDHLGRGEKNWPGHERGGKGSWRLDPW